MGTEEKHEAEVHDRDENSTQGTIAVPVHKVQTLCFSVFAFFLLIYNFLHFLIMYHHFSPIFHVF